MIKIAHFADFHLGMDTIGTIDPETSLNSRVMDYLDTLDAMIDFCEDNKADIILFAGDAFHKRNPKSSYIAEFAKRIARISNLCTIILLVGNHDVNGVNYTSSTSMDIYEALDIDNVIIANEYTIFDLDIYGDSIQIATVPYPFANSLLSPKEVSKHRKSGTLKKEISEAIEANIKLLVDDLDKEEPAILMCHLAVDSAEYGTEHSMYIGDSADVKLEILCDPVWNYVALGHIHKYQDLTSHLREEFPDIPPVVYSGSLERVDFTEETQLKGFMWIEVSGKETNAEFIEVDARPYKTIDLDVCGRSNSMKYIMKRLKYYNIQDAVVRVIIRCDEDAYIESTTIESELWSMGMYHLGSFSIKRTKISTSRLVDEDGEDINLSEYEDEDKIAMYFESMGESEKETEILLSMAREIIAEVNAKRLE